MRKRPHNRDFAINVSPFACVCVHARITKRYVASLCCVKVRHPQRHIHFHAELLKPVQVPLSHKDFFIAMRHILHILKRFENGICPKTKEFLYCLIRPFEVCCPRIQPPIANGKRGNMNVHTRLRRSDNCNKKIEKIKINRTGILQK